jgi:hypothetical protein
MKWYMTIIDSMTDAGELVSGPNTFICATGLTFRSLTCPSSQLPLKVRQLGSSDTKWWQKMMLCPSATNSGWRRREGDIKEVHLQVVIVI